MHFLVFFLKFTLEITAKFAHLKKKMYLCTNFITCVFVRKFSW